MTDEPLCTCKPGIIVDPACPKHQCPKCAEKDRELVALKRAVNKARALTQHDHPSHRNVRKDPCPLCELYQMCQEPKP